MSDIDWTMNCILFGARIISLVRQGKTQEAISEIKNLSSEFDDYTADYLLTRLIELA